MKTAWTLGINGAMFLASISGAFATDSTVQNVPLAALQPKIEHAALSKANRYALAQYVKQRWTPPKGTSGMSCSAQATIDSDGNVLEAEIVKTSGDPHFDKIALASIHEASPLPIDYLLGAFLSKATINFYFKGSGGKTHFKF